MSEPRHLYDESVEILLSGKAQHFASFRDLTGVEFPWETDVQRFQNAQKELYTLDKSLRGDGSSTVTCVVGSEGIYWLVGEATEGFLDEFQKRVKGLQDSGPMPIWRLTSSEMFNDQIANMKRLLLTSVQDRVLMASLKDDMTSQADLMNREFSRSHKSVFKILEDVQQQTGNVEMCYQFDIITLERARITMEMLHRNTTSEADLGYATNDLMRAIQYLEHRIRGGNPRYMKILETVQSHLKNDIRHSESNQLSRAGYWDMAFQQIEKMPDGYDGYPKVAYAEMKGYRVLVQSRESELGMSDLGRSALLNANKAEHLRQQMRGDLDGPAKKKKAAGATGPLTDDQIWELLDKARQKPGKKEKPKHRMAFMERR